METISIDTDISVICIRTESFPGGITKAKQELKHRVPHFSKRRYFGILREEETDGVEYKAGVEEKFQGEACKLNCENFMIRSGHYVGLTIKDYTMDIQIISSLFRKLIALPGIDPEGYCIQWYVNDKDVRCMVRLDS
jgi:hypothetical protein